MQRISCGSVLIQLNFGLITFTNHAVLIESQCSDDGSLLIQRHKALLSIFCTFYEIHLHIRIHIKLIY